MKCQAVTTSDGIILNASGPLEVRKHNWTLYLRRGIDEDLDTMLEVGGTLTLFAVTVDIATALLCRYHFRDRRSAKMKKAWTCEVAANRVPVACFSESSYFTGCCSTEGETYL